MSPNKKIKNTVMVAAFSFFCAAGLSAYQINITVNDKELEFPLEGVKVVVAGSSELSTFTLSRRLTSVASR